MTFKIKLNNGKMMKGIIETLSAIIDETTIKVSPEEFRIEAMDPSRICLLQLTIKKENFDEYKCDKESLVPLNLSDFDKILKRLSANESLELEGDEKDNKIKIKMQKEGTKRPRSFSLALLDIDQENVPFENLFKIEYPTRIEMKTNVLNEAIKDAEIYSEILWINAKNDGLKLSASGQIGEMEYQIDKDDLIAYKTEKEENGQYSLTFLKGIMRLSSITENFNISLKSDHPVKLVFKLENGAELDYFLAPRVEEAETSDEEASAIAEEFEE